MSSLKSLVPRIVLALVVLHAPAALALTAFGVTTDEKLITFDTSGPGSILASNPITGLQVNEYVAAIDVRPSTGQLYALGSTSRLYVIETASGIATQVGTTSFIPPLQGTFFGIDFDPITEQLRVVSDSGQNMRLDPATGTVIDADPNTPGVQPDARLPVGVSVVACAYSNNYPGAANSTLYGIDLASRHLVRIGGPDGAPSPNLGGVTPVGDNSLGLDSLSGLAGLDIATNGERAYAALQAPNGVAHLYTVDLVLGNTTDLGLIGDGTVDVRDIAVLSSPVTLFGVTAANELVRFRSLSPSVILDTTEIEGLQPDENVVGIDVRPSTGRLYALGSTSQLYTIDPTSGAAAPIGGQFEIPLDVTAKAFGFDFNPVSERLRIVSDGTGQNFRLDADTGVQVDSHPDTEMLDLDTDLHPGTEAACAYTNDLPGARSTTLYGINAAANQLVRQGGVDGAPSANGGVLTRIGPLGDPTFAIDAGTMVGFDIAPVDGTAFAALTVGGVTGLYAVDLGSGAATSLGAIGAQPIQAIAVASPGRFEFALPTFSAIESDEVATVTVIRLGGSDGPASVRVTATSGTATAGLDFEAVSPVVVFRDGETSQNVDIPLIDDALVEGPETVHLTLGTPTTSLGSLTTAVLTIVDDDSPPPVMTCTSNAECDDHDRCTTDGCTDGTCTNVLSPRFETVLCELDAARHASLCGADPVKKKLLRTIRRLITQSGNLVQQAASGKKRAATRADRLLAAVQAKTAKAVQGIKISRPCGVLIEQRVQGIRNLLTAASP